MKTLIYGSNTLISIILVGAILTLINVLPGELKSVNVMGIRIPLQKQWDLTESRRFSLADQTLKVLTKLDSPVKAIGFAQKGKPEYANLEDILKRYAFQSRFFTYQIEDPVRNPLIAKQYNVKNLRTLILESKGADGQPHRDTVTLPIALGAADFSQMEAKITAGLLRMINPKPAVVYFLKGHGEVPIDDSNPQNPRSIYALKSLLESDNYTVKSLNLGDEKAVPGDAKVVVIAGITNDLQPAEAQGLQKYLAAGGRLMLFYNATPDMKPFRNLNTLLATQGIAAQDDFVVSSKGAGVNSPQAVFMPEVQRYGNSPITDGFQVPTVFPVTRSFKIEKQPKDATVTALAKTVAETWEIRRPLTPELQMDLQNRGPAAAFDPNKDARGEAIVAVAGSYAAVPTDLEITASPTPTLSLPGVPAEGPQTVPTGSSASGSPAVSASGSPGAHAKPEDKPKTEARIVAFGSVNMIMGGFFGLLGNGDLVMNSVAWLAERTEQIALTRPDVKKQPLQVDETSRNRINLFSWAVLPSFVALLGLFVITLVRKH